MLVTILLTVVAILLRISDFDLGFIFCNKSNNSLQTSFLFWLGVNLGSKQCCGNELNNPEILTRCLWNKPLHIAVVIQPRFNVLLGI